MMAEGIIIELQRDCIDAAVQVSNILRKAKLIAKKLDLETLQAWMNSELNGYSCSPLDLPDYRKGVGQPKFKNPYHGWCPLMTENNSFGNTIKTVFFMQPIAELEDLSRGKGNLIMQYNSGIEEVIQKQLPMPMECGLEFSKAQITIVLDHVRNTILDWSAELELQGIIGEGMTFNSEDRREAKSITNNIYGGNIGTLGNVAGDVSNSDFFNADGNPNIDRLNKFLEQAKEASGGLDDETQNRLDPILLNLETELESQASPPKIQKALSSIKNILEGAGGSVVANALLGLL